MTDYNFNKAKNWFEDLRNQLIHIVSEIDGNDFIKTKWNHRHQGGGTMAKIKGSVIEKGGTISLGSKISRRKAPRLASLIICET